MIYKQKFELPLESINDTSLKRFRKLYNSSIFQTYFFNPSYELIHGRVHFFMNANNAGRDVNLYGSPRDRDLTKLVRVRNQFLESLSGLYAFWWITRISDDFSKPTFFGKNFPSMDPGFYIYYLEFWVVVRRPSKLESSEFFSDSKIIEYEDFWMSKGYGSGWTRRRKPRDKCDFELFPNGFEMRRFHSIFAEKNSIFLAELCSSKNIKNSKFFVFGCNRTLHEKLRRTGYKSFFLF